ncbi:MAG: aldo/keto reductase, partial [Oscillospiraceae bacterium]|nr:aldo/keto reductase [Oscillospiraceae bacterium]
ELLDRLEYHRGLGKIRAYGLSNWEKDRIEEAERYCDLKGYAGISLLEPSYSLATVRAPRWPNTVYLSDEEARYFSDKGLPILSFSPLGGGYFAGVFFRDESRVTEGVRRAYFNDENTEKYRRALLLAEKRGSSPENIALAYIMSLDLLVAPVIGPRTVSELLSSLGAANIRLSEAEIEYLSLRSSYV